MLRLQKVCLALSDFAKWHDFITQSRKTALFTCGLVTAFLIFISLQRTRTVKGNTYSFHIPTDEQSKGVNSKMLKTILYWNTFFGEKDFYFGVGKTPFIGCKETNCMAWAKEDENLPLPVQEFDAVMFHALDKPSGVILENKPMFRLPHQRYLFYLLESPATNKFDFRPHANFFNLTITYRRDSDIYAPYRWIGNASAPSKTPINWLEPNFENISINLKPSKTKAVAWFVSNCKTPSKRHIYVKKLSQFIRVDIYGSCGSFKCKGKKGECEQLLEDNYMFYLSFENSLCQDYVTEKFFKYISYNIVPVVYGGANYKTVAPPMSYIDVKDYTSPEELANYLKFLMKNPEEYLKYFWWKSYYQVGTVTNHEMCSLCAILNAANQTDHVHSDIHSWWNNPDLCHTPNEHFKNSELLGDG